MKISASIFSSKNPIEYAENLKNTDIDCFHLDFFEKDGKAIEEDEFNRYINCQKPLDVHLICSDIDEKTIEMLNSSSTNILSIQIENLTNIQNTIEKIKKFNGDFGFAISPNTDWNLLLPYKNIMKHILVMCSIPGISGAKFIDASYQYIEAVKKEFDGIEIYVDGGINHDIYRKLFSNVSLIVLGSYLYNNRQNIEHTINNLKMEGEKLYDIRQTI